MQFPQFRSNRRSATWAVMLALPLLLAVAPDLASADTGAGGPPRDAHSQAQSPSEEHAPDAERRPQKEPAQDAEHDPLLESFEAELESSAVGYPDPMEEVNRGTLRMNHALDRVLFDPVTRLYSWAVPEPGRRAVRRFLANLAAPSTIVNDLLQGRPKDAGVTFARMVINTTTGWLGLIDSAGCMGLPPHTSDFGQTMALAKIGSGPYLILPLLGPTTVRDAFGDAVGLLFRPTTYFLAGAESLFYTSAYTTGAGLVTLEEHARALRRLESGSLDYYAALRNAYYQNRTAQIESARQPRPLGTDAAYCECPGGCRAK